MVKAPLKTLLFISMVCLFSCFWLFPALIRLCEVKVRRRVACRQMKVETPTSKNLGELYIDVKPIENLFSGSND
jgi:hypothetical protein